MIKTITQTIIDGYGSGETDFLTRFGQSDVQVQIDIETNILNPILAVLNSPDQSAVLTVTGHSDRVDTEGLTREQRRQQEFAASGERANNAAEGVKQIIRDNFLGVVPANLDELQQLAILVRAAGAAVLSESAEGLSEEQRRRNRRVQFRVVRYQPG
jgi:hypothetical protein